MIATMLISGVVEICAGLGLVLGGMSVAQNSRTLRHIQTKRLLASGIDGTKEKHAKMEGKVISFNAAATDKHSVLKNIGIGASVKSTEKEAIASAVSNSAEAVKNESDSSPVLYSADSGIVLSRINRLDGTLTDPTGQLTVAFDLSPSSTIGTVVQDNKQNTNWAGFGLAPNNAMHVTKHKVDIPAIKYLEPDEKGENKIFSFTEKEDLKPQFITGKDLTGEEFEKIRSLGGYGIVCAGVMLMIKGFLDIGTYLSLQTMYKEIKANSTAIAKIQAFLSELDSRVNVLEETYSAQQEGTEEETAS